MADEARHVERGAEAVLPVREEVAEALVRLLRGAEARELAHRPEPPSVHRRVDAAREGIDAGPTVVALVLPTAREVGLRVERLDRRAGERRELHVALRPERVGDSPF